METKPSKTARKRETHALQALGERLIGLPGNQLDAIPLDEHLKDAVQSARRIRSHGAARRQRQLVGKLMRRTDVEPIRAALEALDARAARETRLFHLSERWRDRLLGEGRQALQAFEALTGSRDERLERHLDALSRPGADAVERRHRRELFRRVLAGLRALEADDGE